MSGARRIAIAFALVHMIGCSPKVTLEQCDQLLDRYIDMSLRDDPSIANAAPAQATALRGAKKEQKRRDASYRLKERQCEAEVRTNEFDCAMAANTPNEWEACIQ